MADASPIFSRAGKQARGVRALWPMCIVILWVIYSACYQRAPYGYGMELKHDLKHRRVFCRTVARNGMWYAAGEYAEIDVPTCLIEK